MIGGAGRADNRLWAAYHKGMEPLTPFALLLILVAPAIGSFVAVLADRLPRGQDVVRAPSACRACGHRLGLRDLVPVISFALTRGRCRHCGGVIPAWLLYSEIAAIGLGVIALAMAPDLPQAWATAVFFWLLLGLILCDLLAFRLPDVLTAALAVVAMILAVLTGWPTPGMALWGGVIGAGAFWALRWGYHTARGRDGLGLGDVKLMVGLGAAVGPFDLPLMVLLASGTALAVALVGALPGPARSAEALSATRPLPFGAALAAAGGVVWALRHVPV